MSGPSRICAVLPSEVNVGSEPPTGQTTGQSSGPIFTGAGDTRAGVQQSELGTYTSYEDAQRAVDYLSDQGFPVKHVRIIGHGITTVETVLGRVLVALLFSALWGAVFGT
ncbi:MAG TPA: general stress protein [Glaciibacter sp.]|nr:general stress protein [Glaciibacter sp.]